MRRCRVIAKGSVQSSPGILLAACFLGPPGSLCLGTSTVDPDALPNMIRPQWLSFLYPPTFSCQCHSLFKDIAFYSLPSLVSKAVQIRFSPHDSCLWGFCGSSWPPEAILVVKNRRNMQVDRCKHAVPCARIHTCLKQQTRPLVCSVLDSFNLFLISIPTWAAFSFHIVWYLSCFYSWPSLFSH